MYPYTGLTADALGNAYVPPLPAGVMANGTIFKLSPSAGVVGRETCCYGASQLRRGMRPVLQHWCSTELGTELGPNWGDGTYPRFCVQHIPEEPVNVASVPIFFTTYLPYDGWRCPLKPKDGLNGPPARFCVQHIPEEPVNVPSAICPHILKGFSRSGWYVRVRTPSATEQKLSSVLARELKAPVIIICWIECSFLACLGQEAGHSKA